MNITETIVGRRADALLLGDYNKYRALLTRRLHTLKKRLGRTTPKGKKYSPKAAVTSDDIATDSGFVHLLLFSAERAWASAMHMKSVHSQDTSKKGMVGSARRHIISRLNKASTYAQQLVSALQGQTSNASNVEVLEARGYLASLLTAFWMEKRQWAQCLKQASLARIIYASLEKQYKQESVREFLSGTIDPSIRYSAYQLKIPRSIPLSTIAKKYFPEDSGVKADIETVDPDCLNEESTDGEEAGAGVSQSFPQTITWRSRTVKIEDASISQALASANTAESELAAWMASRDGQSASWKDKAANYDNVIIASQDAVDATKAAIDELSGEGVDQGDVRMQSLQITRTALNYELVGWRVGRNRVLCGEADGLDLGLENSGHPRKSKTKNVKKESLSRRTSRLRERVVLYDATLQSLDIVKELPGVAADTNFVNEIQAKRCYFQSLRCLAIGRSHAFQSNPKNALALFVRASDLVSNILRYLPTTTDVSKGPPRLDLSQAQVETLQSQLKHLVWQYRGIVEIEKLVHEAKETNPVILPPMIERLGEYRLEGVDLANLVSYPPKIEPIPVKPLFLDAAFNYIDYPREQKAALAARNVKAAEETTTTSETKKETKKGWFGFGR